MAYVHISTFDSYQSGTATLPCNLSNANFKAGRGRGKKKICTYFMVADTETSHNCSADIECTDFYAWSYQQAQALFDIESGKLLEYNESRNIEEFVCNFLNFDINLNGKGHGIVFFHNLKFDIRFFRSLIIEKFKQYYPKIRTDIPYKEGGLYEDFMTDSKTWLYFRVHNLEFRCSWRLTGQTLYSFTKDMGVQHRKILGANDYGVHYPDEVLSQEYHDYMFNDVVGLGEAICQMCKLEKLTLNTLPYTATGFPRNDVKRNFRNDKAAILEFMKSKPDPVEFRIWARAYAGGHTQPNEIYKEEKVTSLLGKIKHRDFVSFYPSMIYTQLYPVGKGRLEKLPALEQLLADEVERSKAEKQLKQLAYDDTKLLFTRCLIINYSMKDGVMPFIPHSHVEKVRYSSDAVYYSHKLKEVHGAFIINTCTPELRMIYEYCNCDHIIPIDLYTYKAARMPKPILDTVMQYFKDKSDYKYQVKEAEKQHLPTLLELKAKLQRAKGKLNGIYGMLVEMIIKDIYSIDEDGAVHTTPVNIYDLDNIRKALDDYYGNFQKGIQGSCKNGKCLSYSHGVFITAWAKYFLFKFCTAIGWENVLYCDTDSAFYISTDEIEANIQKLNDELRQEAIKTNAYTDVTLSDGTIKRCYLHYFDDEEENIVVFKSLNAKRYMYTTIEDFNRDDDDNYHLSLTCAGISAGTGLVEDSKGNANYTFTREMEISGYTKPTVLTKHDMVNTAYTNFKNGSFIFNQCGGTTAKYVSYKPTWLNIDNHKVLSEGGIAILGCTKVLRAVEDIQYDEADVYEARTDELFEIAGVYKLTKKEETI